MWTSEDRKTPRFFYFRIMTKEDIEFYKKVEQNNFILCDEMLKELLDRKFERAYTLSSLLEKSKQHLEVKAE